MGTEDFTRTNAERHSKRLSAGARSAHRRAAAILEAELAALDERALAVLAGMTDAEMLTELARRAVAREPLKVPPLVRMRLKGAARFAQLLESHGGVYTAGQAARIAGTTEEALRKAAQRGRVLAFKRQGHWYFPTWQFAADGSVLSGLSRVLKALPTGTEGQGALLFFLSNEGPESPTPLELVRRGDEASLALAERMARRYLEQIGA